MPHSISFDEKEKVIKLTFKGEINLFTVVDMASEVARIAKEHDCFLILNDSREATVALSIMQIYDLPKVFSEILLEKGIQVHKFKRAVVVPTDIDKLTFFETVSANRGQNVMLFHDLQEAKEWLFQK